MDWGVVKTIAVAGVLIAAILWGIFGGLSWAMSDRQYSGGQAAAECGAAGKHVGEYKYEFGKTNFTCVDAPSN